MSPGGSAKGGALCACGVITQGRSSLGPGSGAGAPARKPGKGCELRTVPYRTLPMVLGRAVCQPEKREVDSSILSLTTTSMLR